MALGMQTVYRVGKQSVHYHEYVTGSFSRCDVSMRNELTQCRNACTLML